jgi:hypothetical protein
MGRQVQLHMLPKDLRVFLGFVQARDPVVATLRSSDAPQLKPIPDPSSETRVLVLWNQALLGSLERKHVVVPGREYYGVDGISPTLEIVPSQPTDWNGRASLLQGRIYASFDTPVAGYEKWYNSLARWIRKSFIKNPLPLGGYIGPAAYEWYKKGGLLLPMLSPPVTPQWLSWVEAQDQHRAIFVK